MTSLTKITEPPPTLSSRKKEKANGRNKPSVLDWAIPQEEGIPGSQVARLQLWHNRVVVSRHGDDCLIKSDYKTCLIQRGKTLVQRNTSEGF